MDERGRPGDSRAQTLVDIAREIIRESGDFELSMRELASRAQVSLRTPYALFGSKAGVISAILKADQKIYRRRLREQLRRGDAFDDLFNSLRFGIAFYAENPAFYRALFRATQAYSEGGETEPARENPHRFEALCQRAIAEGLIDPAIRPAVLAATLLDIFAANVRTWASSSYDLGFVEPRVGFGWAATLAGFAQANQVERLRTMCRTYQRSLETFNAPPREVLSGDH